jgi:RND family efflux transporter MFP subunit
LSGTEDRVERPPAAGDGPPVAFPPARLRRIGAVAGAIALLIAVAGIVDREIELRAVTRWTDAQAVPDVAVVMPRRGGGARPLDLPGNVAAWYEAPIYARVSGYVQQWYFDYGAQVKKGDVLATIETPDLDARFGAAKANLDAARAKVNVAKAAMEFAKTTYIRWRDSPKGVVSVQETEAKKADYQSALASYQAAIADVTADAEAADRLRALEQFKRVVSPFDGIVTARNTDIGALINAGSGAGAGSAPQLFRVADVHEIRVFVRVPQAMSGGIAPGMTAELSLPQYPQRVFTAVVATTARAIDPGSRTLLVELHSDNPGGLLQPGTYAQVHFELKPDPNVLTIPVTALIFRQAGMQVAVLGPDNRAELRSVTLGRNFGSDIEVLKGLSPTDRVIDSPPDSLSAGELVSVVNPAQRAGKLASTGGAAAVAATAPRPASASSPGVAEPRAAGDSTPLHRAKL